jgi:hypothetical protein
MSLAHNAIGKSAPGFLNEWVWIKPTCAPDRCATSNWEGPMHLPIAHGEGRFTTEDKKVIEELRRHDQIAFSYCDREGNVSEEIAVTPNGSMFAIAGICNPEGNVVALMPHPERSPEGGRYFESLRLWLDAGRKTPFTLRQMPAKRMDVPIKDVHNPLEIFIDTKIVNNEERTVEQAAHRILPTLALKQLRYISLPKDAPARVLSTIALFNPNKEVAYLRRGGVLTRWNADTKTEESVEGLFDGTVFLRRDKPDTGAAGLGEGSETGICYICRNVGKEKLLTGDVLEIFGNPHASSIELLHY